MKAIGARSHALRYFRLPARFTPVVIFRSSRTPANRGVARGSSVVLLAILASLSGGAVAQAALLPQARVYPLPGTRSATPWTQVSFRDVKPLQLQNVTVTGSSSGRHSGRLLSHSDGNGASFVPDRKFVSGELVTVKTALDFVNGQSGSYTFRVSTPGGPVAFRRRPNLPGRAERFLSRRDLRPAAFRVLRKSSRTAPGDIFVASQFGPLQSGPAIYDPNGGLVYYTPARGDDWVTDFRAQRYQGKPVLSWWQGNVNRGVGTGVGVILDDTYKRIAPVRMGNRIPADLHEFEITPRGTALMVGYYTRREDLRSVGGARSAVVFDGVVQEIDIKTGLVLFEWHSLDQVALGESYIPPPKTNGHIFDYFHINSAGFDRDGNLLVSARDTSAGYKVDVRTGRVIWRLGGKQSTFRMGPYARFAWQHDLRVRSDGAYTLFDDEAAPKRGTQSRAIALRLDTTRRTATLVTRAVHTPPLLAAYEGNNQTLPNGNMFVGWGALPYFTEFDPRGRTLFDARFLAPTPSYRGFRMPWRGRPTTKPRGVPFATNGHHVTVFTTWNGATDVVYWRVLAGNSPSRLTAKVRTVRKDHFETRIHATSRARYFAVQALDSRGRVLSTSAPERRR